jgi:predicted MPP superfamily phosphohydrolase
MSVRRSVRTAAALGAGSAVLAGYAAGYERTAYTLRKIDVTMLPESSRSMRVLHISDLHITPNQHGKFAWLSELARLVPDIVALTGDVISHPDAREPTLRALEPLFAFPGVFVPGNNDYYVPTLRSPHRYLMPNQEASPRGAPLDWPAFAKPLAAGSGWLEMTNYRTVWSVAGRTIDVRGVDDARLRRDRLGDVAGAPHPDAKLVLGLTHTPEPRVLNSFTSDGVGLILAGHTHGGQVRLPGVGAIVTNCGIDRARARGLSRNYVGGRTSWLHVSAGLGTSPFMPFRFCCRPEATLLTLHPTG